jgi:hypothetical protein
MVRSVRRTLPLVSFCLVALGVSWIAACGGSSSTTPQPAPKPTPASVTTALPAAGQTLTFPNAGGFSGQMVVPPNDAPAGTTVTVTAYTTPLPAGPGNADAKRHPLTYLHPMAAPSGSTAIYLATFDFSQALNYANEPQVTMVLPNSYPAANYSWTLELWITTGNPQFTWSTPSISGQTLTFPQGTGTLGGDQSTYYLYLYATPIAASPSPSPSPSSSPSASPSPSPSPSMSPSPSPSPSSSPCNPVFSTCIVSVSTAYVIFADVPQNQWGAGCGTWPGTENFTVSEAGYTGNFTAVSTNTNAATVTPSSMGPFTATDVWTYPSGENGPNFQIYVSDSNGNTTEMFGDFNAECLP